MDGNQKIYCANCANCKVLRFYNHDKSTYVQKIRCSKGQWSYQSGKERFYDYFNLLNHKPDVCLFYDPMCESYDELKSYLKNLRNTLPRSMVIYDSVTSKEVENG